MDGLHALWPASQYWGIHSHNALKVCGTESRNIYVTMQQHTLPSQSGLVRNGELPGLVLSCSVWVTSLLRLPSAKKMPGPSRFGFVPILFTLQLIIFIKNTNNTWKKAPNFERKKHSPTKNIHAILWHAKKVVVFLFGNSSHFSETLRL